MCNLNRSECDSIIKGIESETVGLGFKMQLIYQSHVNEEFDQYNLYIFRKEDNGIK